MDGVYADNVTFFNFTAIYPAGGHCEWKHFGYQTPIREPRAAVLGILVVFQGICGLLKFQHVATGSRYMFSLLFGYGLSSVGHACTLWFGWHKTSSCLLSFLQAITITRLINTLNFPPFQNVGYQLVKYVLMLTFGVYPVLAQVIGSSTSNPWIAWLSFDLIWAGVIVIAAVIFRNRKMYVMQYAQHPQVFHLIFNATVTCSVAYIFWLVDTFACSKTVATLSFYGLWHFLMGLTFYYLITLDAFLQSTNPNVVRWPENYIILYIHIRCNPHGE